MIMEVVKESHASLSADIAKQMSMMQQGGPWGTARSFAVITGVNQGVTLAMRKIQGKEDVRGP